MLSLLFFYLSLGTQDQEQSQNSPRKHQHVYDQSVKFKKKDGNVYVDACVPLVKRLGSYLKGWR